LDNKELNHFFNEYLRTATFPVAVKVSKTNELPPKVKRAKDIFGYPIAFCQGISMARRFGRTIGFIKEDHACPLTIPIFGYSDNPDFAVEGNCVYPLYAKTPEAGAVTQAATPQMEAGEIGSIVLAPLNKADFEPDLLLVYGNAAQIVRMIQGELYNEGGAVTSSFMGRCACGASIVKPLQTQKSQVVIPGGGERVFALTTDDELCFATPANRIQSVVEGIKGTHDSGVARIPTLFFGVSAKPKFPPSYAKLAEYCGMTE